EGQKRGEIGILRREFQCSAEVLIVALAPRPTRDTVVVPAIAVIVEIEELRRQHLRDRRVEHSPRRERIEATVADLELASQLAGRLGSGDIDDATDRVASKQGSLWAAQHLDLADIEEVQELPGAGAEK